MDCPCQIIRDLLPSYLEGTCSPKTEEAVSAHLSQCEDCRGYFLQMQEENAQFAYEMAQLEKWGVLWMLKDLFQRIRQHSPMIIKGIALLAAACVILAAGFQAWQGLTQADCVAVRSEDYQMKRVLQLQDGDIFCSYQVRYPSTFTHHYVILDNTVYFPARRPVLDRTYAAPEEHIGSWIMDPDSVWDESGQTYIPVDAIYLGNPEDCVLVWQRGMELPIASAEEQAMIDAADRTIF